MNNFKTERGDRIRNIAEKAAEEFRCFVFPKWKSGDANDLELQRLFLRALQGEEIKELEEEMVQWRILAQKMTPGGSEFMSRDVVREYYRDSRNGAHRAKCDRVKLQRENIRLKKDLDWCRDNATEHCHRADTAEAAVGANCRTISDLQAAIAEVQERYRKEIEERVIEYGILREENFTLRARIKELEAKP
jgi:hypothetical protein